MAKVHLRSALAMLVTTGMAGAVLVVTMDAHAAPCTGKISFTLARAAAPNADQEDAYLRITAAMNDAVQSYTCNSQLGAKLNIIYEPSVATADANGKTIRFGANRTYMTQRTAMHEIGHTFGVGLHARWDELMSGGVWKGPNANALVAKLTNNGTPAVNGDGQHFWPFGLNQDNEVTSGADLVNHVKIVEQLVKDLG